MAKSILDEALEDTKLLRETAIENARNVLVEAISPQIREFFDSQSGAGNLTQLSENPELLKQFMQMIQSGELGDLLGSLGGDEGSMMSDPMEMDPSVELGDQGMDFGGEGEGDDGISFGDGGSPFEDDESPSSSPFDDETEDEGAFYESKDADEDDKNNDNEEYDMDEVVKIDEQDLAKAWAEVVKEEALGEANVAPGFGDAQNPNKNAVGGLGDAGAPGERGLEDKEKEKMWKDETPPSKEDWTVEAKRYIAKLQNEMRRLHNENTQLNVGVEKLQRSLTEVNLFNSKLLFTNKLLQNTSLTNEQRFNVIEAFDRAESLREVELVYTSLSESFKIAGVLSESKQNNNNSKRQRSSRFTTSATANMLREQSERPADTEANQLTERWQTLAGVLGD